MKKLLSKISLVFFFFGVDLMRIYSFRFFIRFLKDRSRFKKLGGKISHIMPEFGDFSEAAGKAKGHYFHQDLFVSSLIRKESPKRHIDIGSRIDGFVAHVASFREIEVLDIRKLEQSVHKNIVFQQQDITKEDEKLVSCTDSLSCLHALEHFGLGRYGDNVDPQGHIKGYKNLVKMLKDEGLLYISFPIAAVSVVCFNTHRIFEPSEVLTWSDEMSLKLFAFVDDCGDLHTSADVGKLPKLDYGCGIYVLKKIKGC